MEFGGIGGLLSAGQEGNERYKDPRLGAHVSTRSLQTVNRHLQDSPDTSYMGRSRRMLRKPSADGKWSFISHHQSCGTTDGMPGASASGKRYITSFGVFYVLYWGGLSL